MERERYYQRGWISFCAHLLSNYFWKKRKKKKKKKVSSRRQAVSSFPHNPCLQFMIFIAVHNIRIGYCPVFNRTKTRWTSRKQAGFWWPVIGREEPSRPPRASRSYGRPQCFAKWRFSPQWRLQAQMWPSSLVGLRSRKVGIPRTRRRRERLWSIGMRRHQAPEEQIVYRGPCHRLGLSNPEPALW